MKKTILLASAIIIGWLMVTSSTMAYNGWGKWMWNTRSNSWVVNTNYSTYGVNVVRTVTNISNWVEINLTTSDSATLEHMKAMFTQNALKAPKNTLIKVERTQLSNGTKLTVTSTDANTVKLIQDKAKLAKSGLFGNAGVSKKWGKWQWKKMWGWNWTCLYSK